MKKIISAGLLSILVVIAKGEAVTAQVENRSANFDTFFDWCINQSQVNSDARHTVELLLEEANTQDCHQAENILVNLKGLDLANSQVADVSPLASLTSLARLFLLNNQIADVPPLASLTKLEWLFFRTIKLRMCHP